MFSVSKSLLDKREQIKIYYISYDSFSWKNWPKLDFKAYSKWVGL